MTPELHQLNLASKIAYYNKILSRLDAMLLLIRDAGRSNHLDLLTDAVFQDEDINKTESDLAYAQKNIDYIILDIQKRREEIRSQFEPLTLIAAKPKTTKPVSFTTQ